MKNLKKSFNDEEVVEFHYNQIAKKWNKKAKLSQT